MATCSVSSKLNTEYNYSACVFRRKKKNNIQSKKKKNLLQQGCLPLQLYTMGGHYPRTDLICCENCRINLRQWGNVEEMSKKDCHHARVLATGYTGGQWNFSNQYSGIAIATGFVLYRCSQGKVAFRHTYVILRMRRLVRRICAIHIRRNCVVQVQPRWFTVLLYLEARKLILFIHNGNLISLDANR